MKQLKFSLLIIVAITMGLVSCKKDEKEAAPLPKVEVKQAKVAYIVNYGNYGGTQSEISIYYTDSSKIKNNAYKTANGIDFTSNIQSIGIKDSIAYFMSNNGDKINIVSAKTLQEKVNPISLDITKPRYFVASGNYAYVSCWGAVSDWTLMPESYIAKINLTSKAVTKIAIEGGTEGLYIKNNKLYIGLTARKKVAIMDLNSNAISYLPVSGIPQHFVEDNTGNLWVSLVSTYSVLCSPDSIGMAVINPQTDKVIASVNYAGISDMGQIGISKEKNKIFVLGKQEWPGTASYIYTVDVVSRQLGSSALISGESFNGFNINPDNNDIYVLISPSATSNGTLKVYNSTATLKDTKETGIAPQQVVFYNITL